MSLHRLPEYRRRNFGPYAVKPAAFEYFRPVEIAEALRLLEELGDGARVLSGGQSLIPMMNLRLATPAYLIDLSAVASLAEISEVNGTIRIGAMTRQRELLGNNPALKSVPLIREAARNIGHVQTRSRGTVGGSLANADPAAELSLTMVTLDATIVVANVTGERRLKAREFFIDAMTTAIAADEIIIAVEISGPFEMPRVAFREFARRHGDFALASVAVQRCRASNIYSVGIGAVATTPLYCEQLSAMLSAGPTTPNQLRDAFEHDFAGSNLLSDGAEQSDYRKTVAIHLLNECVAAMGVL